MRTAPHHRRIALTALAVAITASACGDEDAHATATTVSTPTTSTVSTPATTASTTTSTTTTTTTTSTTTTAVPMASTLTDPVEVPTTDGRHHFLFGAPAGHNVAAVRHIVISLPGHGSTAATDYAAWSPHLGGSTWALASLDWWDGEGEAPSNYLSPAQVASEIRNFLAATGFDPSDVVVLEGFSRGSANTYAVVANDGAGGDPVIDGTISASGKYQASFPLGTAGAPDPAANPQLYHGMPWVLACGGRDPNPERDGCPAMEETSTFLEDHGADVLAVLEDPDADHGAFHRSSLDLPEQALLLLQGALG